MTATPQKTQRPKYADRTDLEKLLSQWIKISGLHNEKQYSAAIVRAATATEIAVSYAIRREFSVRSQFDSDFVDSLFYWANGIDGKLRHLLIPLATTEQWRRRLKKLREQLSDGLNKDRNSIVHGGHFNNKGEAKKAIQQAREFVEEIVRHYEPDFKLKA
jgi:hypothetical protein